MGQIRQSSRQINHLRESDDNECGSDCRRHKIGNVGEEVVMMNLQECRRGGGDDEGVDRDWEIWTYSPLRLMSDAWDA
jgi:hypothetical protein